METLVLIVTLCGSLHNGGFSCEDFVIDSDLSPVDCMMAFEAVNAGNDSRLSGLISDASNDWFVEVKDSSLSCVIENKE